MKIKILCPLWGHEHLSMKAFLDKIAQAGYDGLDTWIPESKEDKRILYDYLQRYQMPIVSHQHAARGDTFAEFCASFLENLHRCAEPSPILINSHTGRDYFTFEENLYLVDIASEFTYKTGISVLHETHRGRLGYSPQMVSDYFDRRPDFCITADFSHWSCVTESMLENFVAALNKAIERSRHIHARVGFEQGPQVADPRAPEWRYALEKFCGWWDRIVEVNRRLNQSVLTITTEFGPQPYMPAVPFEQTPLADQFAINCFMKDLLRKRYESS